MTGFSSLLDALDECDAKNHRKDFLNALKTLRTHSNFSIEDIKKDLKGAPQIIIGAHDDDLERYISREIESSDNIDEIDEDFKIEIITRVSQAAQKMFLLAVLQIQKILAEPTAGDMEEALKDMPRGLNDAFEETLQRIHKLPEGRRRLGLNTLMWMSHVRKPLTVGELSDALATRLGEASLNTKYRPSQKRMVDCCLGLVTVDEETSIIRLVHYTAQEYLQEHLDQTFDLAGQTIAELIAELALTYLMTEPFAQGCCPDEVSIWSIISRYPFIKYASQFWGDHVLNANSEGINKIAFNYLQARPQLEMSFQICRYTLGYREVYWEPKEARSANGLHIAAYFGLDDVAKQVLDANALDVDSATSMGTTALILASASGQIPILKPLLKKGANTQKENWYGTALHCSAESGKVSSIIELLETGIDVNIRSHGRTAFVCAVSKRHIEAMLELVKRGGKE